MALGAIVARILTQYSDKGSKAARRDITKLGQNFDKFAKVAVRSFAIAAAAGAAFAFKFGSDSVKAAMQAQSAQSRLSKILLTTGGATEKQIAALNDQAAALERVGVVSASNITVVQSQLATFDLYGKTIATLTPAILDYVTAEKGAAASADQFKTMTNGLALALSGQFGALTRVGFVIDAATKKQISQGTETERAEAIVKVLNSTYKGFNESLRDTDAGSIQTLQNAFNALKETVGKALLPVIRQFTDALQNGVLPKIAKWIALNQGLLVESFQKAAMAGYELFSVALQIGDWAINNFDLIKSIAILFAGMFVVGKIAAFIIAIDTIKKAFIALRTVLIGTAIAQAFATGGASVLLGAAAVATMGIGALAVNNMIDQKQSKKYSSISGVLGNKYNNISGVLGTSNSTGVGGKPSPWQAFIDSLNNNTKATKNDTKSKQDAITKAAMAQNLARQATLSGSKTIAIGGGSKMYAPQGAVSVVVNNAVSATSKEDLVQTIVDGIQKVQRRNTIGMRYAESLL